MKNAGSAGRETFTAAVTKQIRAILDVLAAEGYITGYEEKEINGAPQFVVTIAYENGVPRLHDARRISSSARRQYKKAAEIGTSARGRGHSVVSTPEGVMTGAEAAEKILGGEVLFEIW